MSAHSSESYVGFYEQKLADLQVELKRLKVIADKGSYNQYKELKRRIQALLDEQAVSDFL